VSTGRTVSLRAERNGADWRNLDAYIDEAGNLVIDGQDLGPGTAMMSDDGEYEWKYTFPPSSIGPLLAALGGGAGEHILDVLSRRYTGPGSYDLEAVIRATKDTIPRQFWNWRG
jgi:hypothetical protein